MMLHTHERGCKHESVRHHEFRKAHNISSQAAAVSTPRRRYRERYHDSVKCNNANLAQLIPANCDKRRLEPAGNSAGSVFLDLREDRRNRLSLSSEGE